MSRLLDQQQARTKVMGIIAPFVRDKAALESAKDETRILEDLGVNSARLVDIILAFEDEFGISIDDAAADKVRTIGDAVRTVVEKTAA
jgi:acyl carrier protein